MVVAGRFMASASLILVTGTAAAAPLELSSLFTDHMVMQRDTLLKISGISDPGDTIKVKISNSSAEGKVDDDGKWQVQLPPQEAGGPFELTVSDSDETTTIRDVLFGEVWVCSGQSNMDWPLSRSADPEKNISEANHPEIRLYKVPRQKAVTPQDELEKPAVWEVCSPETIPDFSAVGYYFGRELHRELDVPIGLIHSAWGGTRVEWWTPAEELREFDIFADQLKEVEAGITDEQLADNYKEKFNAWLKTFDENDPGMPGDGGSGWADPSFEDSSWLSMQLPGMFQPTDFRTFDGSVWFRRTFTVPEKHADKTLKLHFCADDRDDTYINGKKIGEEATAGERSYTIPAGVVKTGENTITIRVVDTGKNGGICGKPDEFRIVAGEGSNGLTIPLRGEWRFKKGIALDEVSGRPTPPNAIRPTVLYNAMIAPLLDFAVRGVIWYQGEGNANETLAPIYAKNFSKMINGWRGNWGIGDFPFLFVQLASYRQIETEPGESEWAELREAQEDTMKLTKNTAMASAIDIGEQDDIHPKNKLDVGKRLALGALVLAYGKDIEHLGPLYKAHEIRDGNVIISFTHADDLNVRNGEELKGFAIAGADKKFVWADAKIEGNTVVVSSPKVPEPVAVRYGWANFSEGNLYNGAGLPASPFRTDRPTDLK